MTWLKGGVIQRFWARLAPMGDLLDREILSDRLAFTGGPTSGDIPGPLPANLPRIPKSSLRGLSSANLPQEPEMVAPTVMALTASDPRC